VRTKYTKELLEPVVASAHSIMECLKQLGLQMTGGNHSSIKKYIRHYDLDTSHFRGQGWAKGQTQQDNPSVSAGSRAQKLTHAAAFSSNGPGWLAGSKLYKRLVALGREERCTICKTKEWMGKPLRLDVDHINGIPNDNREENLRFLCPNCHRQTPTWGNKKRIAL